MGRHNCTRTMKEQKGQEMKRLSLKDVARMAGVAPSTVSFVLNGKARQMRISEELAEKVMAVVKRPGISRTLWPSISGPVSPKHSVSWWKASPAVSLPHWPE